ncbi:Threonine/homoserine/homoserine lactone efflux protein [Shimia gijangensis]|uniref:Threonine/homoserine/homoserine lactone efflux protein n=1 Tax=Shimia gijangensis TaxID=1470563 RepID=A0A1M6BJC4_9RHOB|nr:LysE family translocator [Shimia gijangensis]SHI48819.1 Threonine/homoserine/homoserine lactone efflux protein [Shimia gijangensis]
MSPEIALILLAWAIAGGSPGPATLAISGTSMSAGRSAGLTIAAGIVCGSATWGVLSALGMGAVMLANAWVFEVVRYVGAMYLAFLAVKSLKRAMRPTPAAAPVPAAKAHLFSKGMLLHLTNPKAVLSWGAIYAIALPDGASMAQVWTLFGQLICVSVIVFLGYGLLFSSASVGRFYRKSQRWFEFAFGILFGVASLKILTARLEV